MRGYQGIGLGLSIAYEVVKRHGGNISVTSKVGVGTTFTVRMPTVMEAEPIPVEEDPMPSTPAMRRPEQQEDPKPSTPAVHRPEQQDTITRDAQSMSPQTTKSAPETTPERKPVILNVDDDQVNQEVIRRSLGDKYEVHVAMDGQEALDYLSECETLPDVVLLDVMMPGMTGFEVCKRVRQQMNIPETVLPILMLSATTQDAAIIEGFASGCNDYI
eukprot:CAMPEP_0195088488 /NCGR_PEP_ID=MMETSP0448-20130528/28045_1 /TAXON_ID=66468 /ORGANISM="Heterocapsa triquestra, Strain CCMP 448" /LENGTH=215 /DNA_ID=CAMNT_0040122143 /DNA_START=1 /DNA_END=645 /DNA_ORIENTATION=-